MRVRSRPGEPVDPPGDQSIEWSVKGAVPRQGRTRESDGLSSGNQVPGPPAAESPPSAAGRRPRLRVQRVTVLAAVMAAVGLLGAAFVVLQPSDPVPLEQSADPVFSPAGPWLSGASGQGVPSGEFGRWRGRAVEIVGTWADNDEAMVEQRTLQPGNEYGDWEGALDVAIGAFSGEDDTWADAADGEYDRRWRQALRVLEDLRGDRAGPTFIRFAHEMNGNWYPWSVGADDAAAFVDAWRRFRDLQEEIFPEARLVFCVNRESVDTGMDWRDFFPGAEHVDVMAVDYYNQNPYVDTDQEWDRSLLEKGQWGGPKGLEQHRLFAESVGLPLAVPEWSGSADEGDSPAFIRGMHDFFDEHAGDGAGELLYEIQFNIDKNDLNWLLFGEYTRMPESAEAYRSLW